MGYEILLGASAWDAVAYVRNQIEDTDPTNPIIPDAALKAYLEDVLEDFQRWVPIKGVVVGDVYAGTSPLNTVAGQRRYALSAANGFSIPVVRVTDVLYRSTGGYSAASELTYLTILPFSPVTAFLTDLDLLIQPTLRYERNAAFNELDHYGVGFYELAQDAATGLYAVDLAPIPTETGLPIYVKYDGGYAVATDGNGNSVLANIPEWSKRYFARLLLATVKDQEAERITKAWDNEFGIVKERGDARGMRESARELRQSVYESLGAAVPAAMVSN